ncbi:MAG TPA: caspase family protein, partial [Candidatus Melainabacteria bacterium]|nr:caspase family protein [Candidatus Melainabacteria bacterium]
TTVQIKDFPDKIDEGVNKPIDDKWALIIGISKFQKPEVNLKYPAKDAADLREFLIKEANFSSDHVKLLTDEKATKANVLAEIGDKWLPRVAHPNDLVLIFISTHGSPSSVDLEGLNYLVMHDTDPASLYATGLPLQDLAAAVKQRVHANRVILIVDACHSGAANPAKGLTRIGNFDSNSLLLGTGQLIICSSEPNQVSWESKRYENGVFTRQLIQALRAKGGKVALGEAFEKLKDSVVSEVLKDRGELQSPVMKMHWSGKDLILSAPPSKPH